MSGSRRLSRSITTASASSGGGSDDSSNNPRNDAPESSTRTRKQLRAACSSCRKAKAACDGARPRCMRCIRRNRECQYITENIEETHHEALKRENRNLRRQSQQLSHALATAQARLLMSAETPSLDAAATSWAERELLAIHPNVYRLHPPLRTEEVYANHAQVASLSKSLDQGSNINPGPALFSGVLVSPLHFPEDTQSSSETDTLPLVPVDSQSDTAICTVSSAGVLCDPRLLYISIRNWTDVAVPDDLAARAISWFLQTDHPLLGLFDAELFVRDLVKGDSVGAIHCSRLLVNSILYWASHGYSSLEESIVALAPEFLQSALMEWSFILSTPTPNVQTGAAAAILAISLTCDGDDAKGAEMMTAACSIGHALDLYGPPPLDIPSGLSEPELDNLRAESHFAWGLFSLITFRSFLYRTPLMQNAPRLPIPGNQGILAYDLHGQPEYHILPAYMGNTFALSCEFWSIANQVVLHYFADASRLLRTVAELSFAESVFQKMLEWADSNIAFPTHLENEPHHAVILQLCFHNVVIHLFKPLQISDGTLSMFGYKYSTPSDIITASLQQLRFYVLRYPLRHPIASHSVLWHESLLHVLNAAVDDLSDPTNRFFFVLCLRRYWNISKQYPILKSMVYGCLVMAMNRGTLSKESARQLLTELGDTGEETPQINVSLDGSFVLDFSLAIDDQKAAQIGALVEAFERSMSLSD